jgi:CHAT domain-containing protein
MPYQDFHVRISGDGSTYTVLAQYGPHTASEPMALAVDRHDALNDTDLTLSDVQKAGTAIFSELMQGKVGSLYHRARGEAGVHTLRIRFHFDPADRRTAHLRRVPWEILFDAHDGPGRFLALDPRTPIVRTIDTTATVMPPSPDPIRRVLLVVAAPNDWPALDIDRDAAVISSYFDRIGGRAEILRHAGRETLTKRLQSGDFQIVHVMGHGTQPEGSEEGALWLEDESGRGDPVPALTLAHMFSGVRAPNVVCLATCHSANPGQRPSIRPFGSIAAALAGIGLPAVIAMRTAVLDESAQALTTRFYERIVEGQPVEAALANARSLVRARPSDTDWVVPLMYVREIAANVPDRATSPATRAVSAPRQTNHRSVVVNNPTGPVDVVVNQFDKRGDE